MFLPPAQGTEGNITRASTEASTVHLPVACESAVSWDVRGHPHIYTSSFLRPFTFASTYCVEGCLHPGLLPCPPRRSSCIQSTLHLWIQTYLSNPIMFAVCHRAAGGGSGGGMPWAKPRSPYVDSSSSTLNCNSA